MDSYDSKLAGCSAVPSAVSESNCTYNLAADIVQNGYGWSVAPSAMLSVDCTDEWRLGVESKHAPNLVHTSTSSTSTAEFAGGGLPPHSG